MEGAEPKGRVLPTSLRTGRDWLLLHSLHRKSGVWEVQD